MMKYSASDIILVTNKFLKFDKLQFSSEFLKEKVQFFAKNMGNTEYKSLYPYTAIWKINSECNLRCKHCFFYGTEEYLPKNDLSTEEVYNVIEQLADLGIMEVRLTGGEIFLRKEIIDILKYIKSLKMSIIITTNGTLISDKIAKILGQILSPHTDIVRVSLDGACAETHDLIRGQGIFEKAIKTIKLLVQNNITTFVATTVMKQNVNELSDFYLLLNNLGVKQVMFSKIVPMDESQRSFVPTFEELVFNCSKLYSMIKDTDTLHIDNHLFAASDFLRDSIAKQIILTHIKDKNLDKNKSFKLQCNPDKSFYIDSDGSIYICPLAADYKLYTLGNLKTDSLQDVMKRRHNNPMYKHKNLSTIKCAHCEILSFCKGGCMIVAKNLNGSMDMNACEI